VLIAAPGRIQPVIVPNQAKWSSLNGYLIGVNSAPEYQKYPQKKGQKSDFDVISTETFYIISRQFSLSKPD
jgi:hypothetical protein